LPAPKPNYIGYKQANNPALLRLIKAWNPSGSARRNKATWRLRLPLLSLPANFFSVFLK